MLQQRTFHHFRWANTEIDEVIHTIRSSNESRHEQQGRRNNLNIGTIAQLTIQKEASGGEKM